MLPLDGVTIEGVDFGPMLARQRPGVFCPEPFGDERVYLQLDVIFAGWGNCNKFIEALTQQVGRGRPPLYTVDAAGKIRSFAVR